MSNNILDYLDELIRCKKEEDIEGLEALEKDGETKYVTIKEVGEALLDVTESLAQYTEASQAVTEVRTRAIVECLPEEVQNDINKLFEEAGDDLLTYEGDELNND